MKKLFFYIFLLALLICGCSDGNVNGAPPDANAKYVIDTVIKPLYVCCNNSCYTRFSDDSYCDKRYFRQYQGGNVNINVETSTISEADRLNGIEWAAKLTLYGGKAFRDYQDCLPKQWTEWHGSEWVGPGSPSGKNVWIFQVYATKRNGKWEYKDGARNLDKGLTCAKIPQ